VGGIGKALMERTVLDQRDGRPVNAHLADYLVPVNLDVPDLEVHFVEEEDLHVNPLGVKGLGEIAIVGVAPAIANAVFHATGKRVRELPIRVENLLPAWMKSIVVGPVSLVLRVSSDIVNRELREKDRAFQSILSVPNAVLRLARIIITDIRMKS